MARRGMRLVAGRLFRVLAVVAVAGVVGPPGTAAAGGAPRIDSVSLSRGTVWARGLALARVTLTTRVSDWPADGEPVFALLLPVGTTLPGGADELVAALRRVSGVPGTGTYQGTVYVPSSARGRWRVASITNMPYLDTDPPLDDPHIGIDPRDDRLRDVILRVHGTHPPVLRISIPAAALVPGGWVLPYPLGDFTTVATLTDAATGRPLPHRNVWISELYACPAVEPGTPTDRRGRVTTHSILPIAVCAGAPLPAPAANAWGPLYAYDQADVWYSVRLRVRIPRGVTRPATRVHVDGNVLAFRPATDLPSYAVGDEVRLERAVGRRWHAVDITKVTDSGRYHLLTAPVRGRTVYRVSFAPSDFFVGAVSRSFPITASR